MAEVIIVHGHPGSGKTTQCEKLANEGLDDRVVQHVSVGNRLRAIRSLEAPSRFSEYINSPEAPPTLPDNVVSSILFEGFQEVNDNDLFLVDGYPRFSHALEDFYQTLELNNHHMIGAVNFVVPLDISVERVLARGRRGSSSLSDEAYESNAIFRYDRHGQTTAIALMAIEKTFPVEAVNGSGTEDEAYKNFVAALGRLALHSRS